MTMDFSVLKARSSVGPEENVVSFLVRALSGSAVDETYYRKS